MPTTSVTRTTGSPSLLPLDPPEPAPGLLVRPADVGGSAAWQDLVRSGALVLVWDDAAAPASVPRTPTLRALAVRDAVPAPTVLAGASAAWVLCGAPRPARLDVVYPRGTHRPPPRLGRVPRQSGVLRSECVLVAGVLVTDVLRTALDVATTRPHAEAVTTLRLLRASCGLDVHAAARSLELRLRWPGRDRAQAALAAAREVLAPQGPSV